MKKTAKTIFRHSPIMVRFLIYTGILLVSIVDKNYSTALITLLCAWFDGVSYDAKLRLEFIEGILTMLDKELSKKRINANEKEGI